MGVMTERQISTEAAVIGCLLIDPEICGELFTLVTPDDFETTTYRHVFTCARNLFFAGKSVDPVAVCHAAGGDEYRPLLMQIMDVTPTAAGWREYAEILKAEVRLHRLHLLGEQLSKCASVEEGLALLAKAQEVGNRCTNLKIVHMADGIQGFYARQESKPRYLPYGIGVLDKHLRTSRGDFVVIGGRPSAGKTALALQLADRMAREHKIGFFSLETSEAQIYDRLVAQSVKIDFGDIKAHKIPEADYARLVMQQKSLAERKMDVIPCAGATVADIQATTLAQRYEVIMIDYLQLLRTDGKAGNRTEEVSQISRALHELAQAHKVTVIALSQLSRPEENKSAGTQKAPTLSNLRESGQIEQDADAVVLLYLTEPGNPRSDRKLKIAKNKEGELSSEVLSFEGRFQQFVEYMPEPAPRKPVPGTPRQMKLEDVRNAE